MLVQGGHTIRHLEIESNSEANCYKPHGCSGPTACSTAIEATHALRKAGKKHMGKNRGLITVGNIMEKNRDAKINKLLKWVCINVSNIFLVE